jgi:hypothetical protein
VVTLQWREPGAFKRAVQQAGGADRKALGPALLVVGLVLVLRAISPQRENSLSWPLMVLVALGAGLAVYGLWWFTAWTPSEILVSEKGINRNGYTGGRLQVEFWSWDRIASASLERLHVGQQSFPALVLHGANGGVLGSIGLSASVSEAAIRDALRRHGKDVRG